MPHAILRALRHRSTPTLLPSTATSQRQEHYPTLNIPSIFITVPDEEGAHHWCALAGTAAPPGVQHGGFDVPLPDFVALEETIDRLKRAGETPTFRRPSPGRRGDEVVLPKKKHANGHAGQHHHHHHQHQQYHVHPHSSAVGTKRPRPKRPQTSPITSRERAQIEGNNVSHDPFAASFSPEDAEMLADASESSIAVTAPSGNGRFTSTNVLRSLSKSSKKQKNRPSPVLTSVSYESVVSPQFSAPAQFESLSRASARASHDSIPKQRKRSSLGWLFSTSSKRASVSIPDVEALEIVVEQNDVDAVSYGRNTAAESTSKVALHEQIVEYAMPACFEADHAEEPPMSPVETHESDLDKPLPPLPSMPASASAVVEVESEEAAEMEINDSVQVQVVMAINDAFKPVDFVMTTMPTELPTTEVPPSNPPAEKEKKVKRKFSLKRLRERFLSGTSTNSLPSADVQDVIPPVPALPPTIIMAFSSSGHIDPPFTPPTLPLDPPFTPPSLTLSGPIDPPFTPPPIPTYDSLPTSEDGVIPETTVAVATSTVSARQMTDEESNISTSSEDSGSSAASSSTPDSTPPDTPDSAHIGPVFGLLQGKDGVAKESMDGQCVEVDIAGEPVETGTGIKRSSGMRRQLDSLRFADVGFASATA